uniref:Interleukin-12 subunit beta n=1 Tax=Tetraodon nigroviridis TaxID=99883 RepID=H3C0A7_TETNG
CFIFTVVCMFFSGSNQNPLGIWSLRPHILVVEVDGTWGQLPLSCLTSSSEKQEEEGIFWMNNRVMEKQKGNLYVVHLEESLGGGNYTCHSKSGSLLNYTVVLIKEVKLRRKILLKNDQGEYLSCSAKNFDGEFVCSWSWHTRRAGRVALVTAHRSSGRSEVTCSVDDGDGGIWCRVEQHCPYAEESQPVQITIHVSSKHFLVENYSRHFFLSDIVKPDKVTIRKVNATMVAWSYPSSWNSPSSYFPLTFQIARLKKTCKACEEPCAHSRATKTLTVSCPEICQHEVKKRTKGVCVRAKDALCDSQWGEWSFLRIWKKRKVMKQDCNPF